MNDDEDNDDDYYYYQDHTNTMLIKAIKLIKLF